MDVLILGLKIIDENALHHDDERKSPSEKRRKHDVNQLLDIIAADIQCEDDIDKSGSERFQQMLDQMQHVGFPCRLKFFYSFGVKLEIAQNSSK